MKHLNCTWTDVENMPCFEREYFVKKLEEYFAELEKKQKENQRR